MNWFPSVSFWTTHHHSTSPTKYHVFWCAYITWFYVVDSSELFMFRIFIKLFITFDFCVVCICAVSFFVDIIICVLHAVFPFACFFYYKEMFPFVCIKFKLYIYIERQEKKIVQNKKNWKFFSFYVVKLVRR